MDGDSVEVSFRTNYMDENLESTTYSYNQIPWTPNRRANGFSYLPEDLIPRWAYGNNWFNADGYNATYPRKGTDIQMISFDAPESFRFFNTTTNMYTWYDKVNELWRNNDGTLYDKVIII